MEQKKSTKEKDICFDPNKTKPCSEPCTCKIFHEFDGAKLIAKSTRILQSEFLTSKDEDNLIKTPSIIVCKIDADDTRKTSVYSLKLNEPRQHDCKPQTSQIDAHKPVPKQSIRQTECKPRIDCQPKIDCKNQKGESVNQTKQSILSLAKVHKVELDPCEFQGGEPQSFFQIVQRQNHPNQKPERSCHPETLRNQSKKACCNQQSKSYNQVSVGAHPNRSNYRQNYCRKGVIVPHQRLCHQQRQLSSCIFPKTSCAQQFNKVSINQCQNTYQQSQSYQRACHQQQQLSRCVFPETTYAQQFNKLSINRCQNSNQRSKSCNQTLNNLETTYQHQTTDNQMSIAPDQQMHNQHQRLSNQAPTDDNRKSISQQQQTSNEGLTSPWIHQRKNSLQQNQNVETLFLIDAHEKLRIQLQKLSNQILNGTEQIRKNSQDQDPWSPWIYSTKKEGSNTSSFDQQQLLSQQLIEALIKLRKIHDYHNHQLRNEFVANKIEKACHCKQDPIPPRQSCTNKPQTVDQCFCYQSIQQVNNSTRSYNQLIHTPQQCQCYQQNPSLNKNLRDVPRQCSCNQQNQKICSNQSSRCCKEQNQSINNTLSDQTSQCCNQQTQSITKTLNDRPQQCCCNQSLTKVSNDLRRYCCNQQNKLLLNNISIDQQQKSCHNQQNQSSIKILNDQQSSCGTQQQKQLTIEGWLDQYIMTSNDELTQNCGFNFMKNALNNSQVALALCKKTSLDIQNRSKNISDCHSGQQPMNITTETICMTVKNPQKSGENFSKIISTQNDGKQLKNKQSCGEEYSPEENLLACYCTDEYIEFETDWIKSSDNEASRTMPKKKSSQNPKDKTPIYKTNINTEFVEKDVRKTVNCSVAKSCFEKGFPYRRFLLEAYGLIPGSEGHTNDKEESLPTEPKVV